MEQIYQKLVFDRPRARVEYLRLVKSCCDQLVCCYVCICCVVGGGAGGTRWGLLIMSTMQVKHDTHTQNDTHVTDMSQFMYDACLFKCILHKLQYNSAPCHMKLENVT